MTGADDPKTTDPGSPSGPVANETPEQAIERLSGLLAEKTAEAERSHELYLRERAELENYKKRTQREYGESLRYASTPLARDLAPVVDDLERAVEHAASGGNGKPLVEGVSLVLRNLLDALAKHGITRIDAVGEAFDPARHEALAMVPDATRPPNQVVQQYQPGFALHGRVIRPAKVAVSTKPSVETDPDDD